MSDKETPDPDSVESLGMVEGDSAVFVVDPDNYSKTRKIKTINDAKEHVHELRRNMPKTAPKHAWSGIHTRLAEAVSIYGSELLPLIEDGLEHGILEQEDLETPYCSVDEFIHYDGKIDRSDSDDEFNLESAKPVEYMVVFRQLDRIQRKLGLGLELQEEKGPAEI